MPIPNDPVLYQVTLFAQWGYFSPIANALGFVLSSGAAARIG
jgi:hypothetical protein